MLVLPLWTICAMSLVSIFSPLLKELQEPSIALLQSASGDGASLDCVKIVFGDWLQISSMGDVGRLDTTRPPPSGTIRSSPVIVYLPSSTDSIVLSPSWNGTNDYILIPTESSLATITQSINSLSLVTPFKVYPPRFPPPHPRIFESGSAVDGAGETGSELPVVVSNDGLPLFLALVAATFLTFHLMVYVSWKMKLAKERQSAEKKETAKQMEDLRKTKFVLGKQKESYLKGVLDDIDKISKESEASVDPQVKILEHLYIEGDSSSAEPKLFSVKRWTIAKSEFDSTYVWRTVPRVPSVDPSTVVSQFPVEVASPGVIIGEREQFRVHKRPKGLITTGAPKRIVSSSRPKPLASKSDSDIGGQKSVERPAVANDVQSSARQSNNGGLPQSSKGSTERASTVVSDIHVERPSDPERPSVTRATVDRQASPESPSVMVDIQAEGTADMDLRQGKVADIRSSTSVDILVEGASNPATPSLVTVTTAAAADSNTNNTVEPSTMVDIHVEGTPVVTEEPSGSASIDTGASVSDTPTVVADNSKDQGDGYESSTSVRTAILAAPTDSLPAAATATAIQAEASSVSEEATPSPARRRKNRMGQRQRRKLREMRENRPPQSADEPEEGSKD